MSQDASSGWTASGKDIRMTTETILANATLVLPGETLRGQLRLADGRIAEIAEGSGVPAGAIDCAGDLVMPA